MITVTTMEGIGFQVHLASKIDGGKSIFRVLKIIGVKDKSRLSQAVDPQLHDRVSNLAIERACRNASADKQRVIDVRMRKMHGLRKM